jgi:hypothetical protein
MRSSEFYRHPLTSPLSRSQVKTERIRYIKHESSLCPDSEKEEATGKLREWTFPERDIVHSETASAAPRELLIAIASRERRVLDLKAGVCSLTPTSRFMWSEIRLCLELAREEYELDSLKKQFHREASYGNGRKCPSTAFERSIITDAQDSFMDARKDVTPVSLTPGDCFTPISSDLNGDVNFLEAVEKLKIGGRWISGMIGVQLEDGNGQVDMRKDGEFESSPRSTTSLELEDSRRTSTSSYTSSSSSVSMLSPVGRARRSHTVSPSGAETVSSSASELREDGKDGYLGLFISSLRRNESVKNIVKRGKALVDSIEDGIIRVMDVEPPVDQPSHIHLANE